MSIDTRTNVNITHTITLTQEQAQALAKEVVSIFEPADRPLTDEHSPALAALRDELRTAMENTLSILHDLGMDGGEQS